MNRSTYVILKWVLIVLGAGGLLALATKLALGGFLPWVIGIAFLAMCVLVVYGPRRGVPAEVPVPGTGLHALPPGVPDRAHGRDVVHQLRRRPPGQQAGVGRHPHRPVGAGGPGLAPVCAERRRPRERRPADRRPVLPADRPDDEEELRRRRQGVDPPAGGRSHQERDRQDHRRPGLHDPQRPPGQRPARPQDLRRTHRRRRRDQGGRSLRGVRRKPTLSYDAARPTPSPTRPPATRTSPRTPPGSTPTATARACRSDGGRTSDSELHQRPDRPHPAQPGSSRSSSGTSSSRCSP